MSATPPATQMAALLDRLGHATAAARWRPFLVTADSARSFGLPAAWGGPAAHHVDVGIREGLALTVASGLAREGFDPFVACFAAFGLHRGAEALGLIAREDHPVVVLAGMAGLSAAQDGATHHCLDDLGVLATMPTWRVYCPSDPASVEWTADDLLARRGPAWIRVVREPVPAPDGTVTDGVRVVRPGSSRVAVVGYGPAFAAAVPALPDETRVVEVVRVQPLPATTLHDALDGITHLVVLEEHRSAGGLGDRLRASIVGRGRTLDVLGVDTEPGSAGYADLLEHARLTGDRMAAEVRRLAAIAGRAR